jgi:hypothetical protein
MRVYNILFFFINWALLLIHLQTLHEKTSWYSEHWNVGSVPALSLAWLHWSGETSAPSEKLPSSFKK